MRDDCPFIPNRAFTEELSDVGSLKQHLRTLHGFPLCIQQILHHGLCLDDAFKLDAGLLIVKDLIQSYQNRGFLYLTLRKLR